MIGPNSEYLEAKFAASSEPRDIAARLKRALATWETLRKEKGYANKPIPPAKTTLPPGIQGEIIFRVNTRDLPRRPGDQSGRRITPQERQSGGWLDFIKWAWNENYLGLPRMADFVPKGDEPEPVGRTSLRYIAKEALIDVVRGQNSAWTDQEIKALVLTMTRYPAQNGKFTIIYQGRASMSSDRQSYDAICYGEGIYNPSTAKFESLDLVWTGSRSGAGTFNQRDQDRAAAPMGVTLSLFKQ